MTVIVYLTVTDLATLVRLCNEKKCLLTQARREGNSYTVVIEGSYGQIAGLLLAAMETNI